MVNTQLLDDWIIKSGKKKGYLADKCECSIQAFRLKCKNKYDFTNTQVNTLCDELGITKLSDKEKIFNYNVDI